MSARIRAELVFFSGTMDSGKSTLALQLDHNHRRRGRHGLLFTLHDRAGRGRLSSRLGLEVAAVEMQPDLDVWAELTRRLSAGERIDYLVCDEAQFYTARQIEDLARVVDDLGLDVFAFGITTDFRTQLFPGSARLLELADRVEVLQVEALCWCGARATHNARTVGGVMVVEGDQLVVGDTSGDDAEVAAAPVGEVAYEVLCRRHHLRRLTAASAHAAALSPEPLPFDAAGNTSGDTPPHDRDLQEQR
ncbi:MAG: thymidine kinase [Actinomycetales bacterium]